MACAVTPQLHGGAVAGQSSKSLRLQPGWDPGSPGLGFWAGHNPATTSIISSNNNNKNNNNNIHLNHQTSAATSANSETARLVNHFYCRWYLAQPVKGYTQLMASGTGPIMHTSVFANWKLTGRYSRLGLDLTISFAFLGVVLPSTCRMPCSSQRPLCAAC